MTDGELLSSIGSEQSEDTQGQSNNETINDKRAKRSDDLL